MAEKTSVHGFSVSYEENARDGVRYLRDDLDFNEARIFFDQSRERGQAQFEDDNDRQFTLIHQNGVYALVRR